MPKVFPREVHVRFFELVCSGSSITAASAAVGVARDTGTVWWRKSGRMELQTTMGARGGLVGDPPPACVGEGQRRRALTSEDRAVIAAGLDNGLPYARIGAQIGRNKSVICRELARNRGRDGSYIGAVAHRAAHERRRRPKEYRLIANPELGGRIEAWMDDGWSPKLIADVLAHDHLGTASESIMNRVSHETIYQALYVQTRGSLRADLHQQLSLKRAKRKTRASTGRGGGHTYDHALRISQRPAQVADRAVPGHWEGDLILGPHNRSAIGTLVERSTRFTMLLHLPGRHDAASVAEAMIAEMSNLPAHLRRSITWDRGSELAEYVDIQLRLQAPVYFCDPHSPWQRGTNENTNRLLRFWFEKGSDLSAHTPEDLARVATTLNARPRPTLDLKTPAQALNELLAQAAA